MSPASPQPSYTPRALLVGLLAVVALSVGTQFAELWIHGTQITQSAPPINSFFVWIVIVVLVNTILRLISRTMTLTRGELLLIYSMLIVCGGVVGIGLVHFIPAMITAPFYYGTPDQPWTELVEPFIPRSEWFAPRDELVIKYGFEGMPPTWTVPWQPWVKPLLVWSLLGLLMAWCTICICAMLRRQWVENERLIFPLNYVPLAMTDPSGGYRPTALHPFFRNRLMWAGFAIPTILHAFNSLHQYWPGVPAMNIRAVPLDKALSARPWNAARPIQLWFYPMAVGLAYLLSRDISFSLWFFYFIGKAEAVLGSALGLGGAAASLRGFPFIEEQGSGALLALALGSLWVARRHLRQLWDAAVRVGAPVLRRTDRPPEDRRAYASDGQDPLPPPVAIWGLLIGLALIVFWWQLFGMSPKATLAYFGLWFLYSLGLSRLVCEGGTVWIGTPMDPRTVLRHAVGVPGLAPRDWMMMGYLRFLTVDWRCLMMPNVMSSFKFLEKGEMAPRGLVGSMMGGIALSVFVSFATITVMSYVTPGGGIGLSTWRWVGVAQEPFQVTGQYLLRGGGPQGVRMAFMGMGAAGMLALQALRARFLWWPLHPLGYPMLGTFAMRNMWFSTLVAWAVKSLVLRYGGIPVYEHTRPFFLGLILGDFFNIALWLVIEGFTGLQDHFLYP
jgi:hypothetical protein